VGWWVDRIVLGVARPRSPTVRSRFDATRRQASVCHELSARVADAEAGGETHAREVCDGAAGAGRGDARPRAVCNPLQCSPV